MLLRVFRMLRHPVLCSLLVGLSLLVVGCAGKPPAVVEPENGTSAETDGPRDADQFLVVDCLLPGQVRQLGANRTYLTQRRAIRTTAVDCAIRGGEYVAYDRSNYRTALKVWLPQAQAGDAEAQNYVGEIYEQGLGLEPDYALAAQWYRQAADQGYSPAQINLGYLFEQGLGVERDVATALNWYRQASGLDDGTLEFVSSAELKGREARQAELAGLREEVEARREREQALQSELASARRTLDDKRRALAEATADLEQLRERIETREQATPNAQSAAGDRDLQQLRDELARKESTLAAQRTELTALQERVQAERQRLERAAGQAVARPTIEVLEPPLTLTRGQPLIRVRSIRPQVELKGRVRAAAGLEQLRINERSAELNERGLFSVPIDLSETGRTPVSIVAEDRAGQRSELELVLSTASVSKPAPETADPLEAEPVKVGDIAFGRYHALIIANQDYQNLPDLKTPIRDARAIGSLLEARYGFEVTILQNGDRYTILSELNELRGRLRPKDNLLIYYAGHGELDEGSDRGYWLPIDANWQNPANWIANTAITDLVTAMPAKHILVVADSCYSGSMTRTAVARLERTLPAAKQRKWYRVMSQVRSRTVLTSGGLAPVLDVGRGDHSVFAQAFIDVLAENRGVLEGHTLFRQVAERVAGAAASFQVEQNPQYAPIRHAGHEASDFFFVSPQADLPVQAGAQTPIVAYRVAGG